MDDYRSMWVSACCALWAALAVHAHHALPAGGVAIFQYCNRCSDQRWMGRDTEGWSGERGHPVIRAVVVGRQPDHHGVHAVLCGRIRFDSAHHRSRNGVIMSPPAG